MSTDTAGRAEETPGSFSKLTIVIPVYNSEKTIGALVDRHRPDLVFSVPTLYRNMADSGIADGDAFKAVRHYISAGERMPRRVFDKWRAATGKPVLEGIGSSEAAFLFIANRPDASRWDMMARNRPGDSGCPGVMDPHWRKFRRSSSVMSKPIRWSIE